MKEDFYYIQNRDRYIAFSDKKARLVRRRSNRKRPLQPQESFCLRGTNHPAAGPFIT
jgi:hypothetical protein